MNKKKRVFVYSSKLVDMQKLKIGKKMQIGNTRLLLLGARRTQKLVEIHNKLI